MLCPIKLFHKTTSGNDDLLNIVEYCRKKNVLTEYACVTNIYNLINKKKTQQCSFYFPQEGFPKYLGRFAIK